MTMPSAVPGLPELLYVRIAWLTAGVGVNESRGSEPDLDTVRSGDLKRRHVRGLAERVSVHPHEERAVDALARPVLDDRLRSGSDVVLVERPC